MFVFFIHYLRNFLQRRRGLLHLKLDSKNSRWCLSPWTNAPLTTRELNFSLEEIILDRHHDPGGIEPSKPIQNRASAFAGTKVDDDEIR